MARDFQSLVIGSLMLSRPEGGRAFRPPSGRARQGNIPVRASGPKDLRGTIKSQTKVDSVYFIH